MSVVALLIIGFVAWALLVFLERQAAILRVGRDIARSELAEVRRAFRIAQGFANDSDDAVAKLEAAEARRVRLLDYIADQIGPTRYHAIVDAFHRIEAVDPDVFDAIFGPDADDDDGGRERLDT